ncbi:MAG: CYTH domain-containing protein [Pseudomonadota bacterium]
MAEELEIKLSLTPVSQQLALKWLQSRPGAIEGPRKTLVNRYYDTPGGDLNRQRVALRVRQAGDKYIQTLKTQGDFVAGAHRRQEWEWPLLSTELNLGLLADTPLGQGVNLADLKPVFETNFERQVVMIEEGDTVIEVAIDAGHILAGGSRRPLNEVEFELKSGDASRLVAWARALADNVPVFLNLISKAEQGYFLAGLHEPGSPLTQGGTELSVSGFLQALSVAWLKEKPFEVDRDSLKAIEIHARAQGVATQFAQILDDIAGHESVTVLAERPQLGQLQLALAMA